MSVWQGSPRTCRSSSDGARSAPAVRPANGPPAAGTIHLATRSFERGARRRGLRADDRRRRIRIVAHQPAGLFYGVQTLRQLLPWSIEYQAARPRPISVPFATIVDRPRFAWRGAMLDVARHFFGVDEVKRYIDLLALYKLNRLHLHLSDDQGWRIEIKSWPNLTKHGGEHQVGGGAGGFYTQAQYADIVTYAQERFITIVPEIDMPGHTNAALASYPELNCDGKAPALYTGIESASARCASTRRSRTRSSTIVVSEIAAHDAGPVLPHRRRRGPEAHARAVRRVHRARADDRRRRTASR